MNQENKLLKTEEEDVAKAAYQPDGSLGTSRATWGMSNIILDPRRSYAVERILNPKQRRFHAQNRFNCVTSIPILPCLLIYFDSPTEERGRDTHQRAEKVTLCLATLTMRCTFAVAVSNSIPRQAVMRNAPGAVPTRSPGISIVKLRQMP